MRIKHFAGYGSVSAKKLKKQAIGNTTTLIVKVTGNHEQGLTRPFFDPYLIYNWIVKKFDKRENIDYIHLNYTCDDGYEITNGISNEYAIYTITYNTRG